MTLYALLAAFVAGFLAVLVFHQGAWALFHAAGKAPVPAWAMNKVGPLGVPQVISSSFWGGIWGVALAWLLAHVDLPLGDMAAMTIAGGLLTTLVALLVVFPLKGRPFAAGWNPAVWVFALVVNAAWGFGTAVFLRLLRLVVAAA